MAIALPILVMLLELINTMTRKKSIGVINFFFLLLLSGVLLIAYLTGTADAKAAESALDAQARSLLDEHRQIGIYLLYASGILLLLKLLSIVIRKVPMKITYLLVLAVFIGFTATTAKRGKSLVYEHGVNVKGGNAPVEKDISKRADTQSPSEKKTIETETKKESTAQTEESETADMNGSAVVEKGEDAQAPKESPSGDETANEAPSQTPATPATVEKNASTAPQKSESVNGIVDSGKEVMENPSPTPTVDAKPAEDDNGTDGETAKEETSSSVTPENEVADERNETAPAISSAQKSDSAISKGDGEEHESGSTSSETEAEKTSIQSDGESNGTKTKNPTDEKPAVTPESEEKGDGSDLDGTTDTNSSSSAMQ
jgi:uncharacterized membrane protein